MQKLTKAEEEIMQLIWEHEPLTVSDLLVHLGPPAPPHSSISSIVRILEKKKFVGHTAYGRSYVYHSLIPKADYTKFSLKGLVAKYFEGSMNNLVSFLVQEEKISADELKEIAEEIKKDKK